MSVEIRQIPPVRSELRKFVQFGNDLYEGNPYYCLLYTSDAADE